MCLPFHVHLIGALVELVSWKLPIEQTNADRLMGRFYENRVTMQIKLYVKVVSAYK